MAGSGLPPYPAGWYAVAYADEVRPGRVLARPFMGGEVVVYRTAAGVARVIPPHCPHLGAHFAHGGRVEGELLVCPFHGFAYDASGVCVRTGYGTRPPAGARLAPLPLRETNGILLVYHDAGAGPPRWEVPPLDATGWTAPRRRSYVLRDHPQETSENSVDLGHFAFVHGYRNTRAISEPEVDGARFSVAFSSQRRLPYLGRLAPDRVMGFTFAIDVWGLGYSLVTVGVPTLGLEARLWVLATPIDAERLTLRMAASVRAGDRRRINPALAVLPDALVYGLLTRFMISSLGHDAESDFPIWQNKRYLQRPALAAGDGPIGKFRLWARQFYPEVAAPGVQRVAELPGPG